MSADIDKFCRLIQKHISVVCIGSIDKYNDVDGTFKYRLNTDDQDGDVPSFIEFNTDVHQMASSEYDCAMFKASMLIKKNKYIDYTLGNNGLALEDLVLTFVCHTDDWIIDNVIQDYNYLLMEGYAVICPVYYSTYNRKKNLKTWWANDTEEYKNTIIKIGKDYKRSIDFIESRNEFDINDLSYMGYSWGSIMSNILLAIDDRVKFAFICAGGLQVQKSKQEIDAALFTRRINIPVMHITGKNDGIFDYKNSQLPMQKLLGTPLEDQEMIVLEGVGHIIPKEIRIDNHLRWLKKYTY